MTQAPYINRATTKNKATPQNAIKKFDYTTICTDLGRSVGVTIVLKLVLLWDLPSHSLQICAIKTTNI